MRATRIGARGVRDPESAQDPAFEAMHPPTLRVRTMVMPQQVGQTVNTQHGGLIDLCDLRGTPRLADHSIPIEYEIAQKISICPFRVVFLCGRKREDISWPCLSHELEM